MLKWPQLWGTFAYLRYISSLSIQKHWRNNLLIIHPGLQLLTSDDIKKKLSHQRVWLSGQWSDWKSWGLRWTELGGCQVSCGISRRAQKLTWTPWSFKKNYQYLFWILLIILSYSSKRSRKWLSNQTFILFLGLLAKHKLWHWPKSHYSPMLCLGLACIDMSSTYNI